MDVVHFFPELQTCIEFELKARFVLDEYSRHRRHEIEFGYGAKLSGDVNGDGSGDQARYGLIWAQEVRVNMGCDLGDHARARVQINVRCSCSRVYCYMI